MKILKFAPIFLLGPMVHAQIAVFDSANQTTSQLNHIETLGKWTESINKASQQIQQLNNVVSNLDNVQNLLGKGMDQIGIDPSITSSIQLAKAANNFGQALQDLQHNSQNAAEDLNRARESITNPDSWERYVVTSRSYKATQKAQEQYDEQMKRLDQERSKAEAQLRSSRSLGETEKAQAALISVDAAQSRLDNERRRAFEQQQANFIENQNQKDAWEQASRDWTKQEWEKVGEGLDDLLNSHPATKK